VTRSEDISIDAASRGRVLEGRRVEKMARSSHAFVRGNTAQHYEWLRDLRCDFPDGPSVWICGDCHAGNLGPIADGDRKVDIQIRDLDQTVIGNPAHDLVRLALSLASAARGSDLPGVTTAHMLEEMMKGYEIGLTTPYDEDRVDEPSLVATVRQEAIGRKWRHLARERIEDVRPRIPLGKKFWSLSDDEKWDIGMLLDTPAIKRLILTLNKRSEKARVELIDAAYWMKGCSSLGKLRYAALAHVSGERKDKLSLVDIKEAVPTVAPSTDVAAMPRHYGERVVAGARALSPNLGDRMASAELMDRPVIVRELMPEDMKLEIEQFSRAQARGAARYLAFVVGRAHGRQMTRDVRLSWKRDLQARSSNLEAPSWLWQSVVGLMARHEQAYLEHCRRYALIAA
jgi:uncharacterized protein (DUF2252 family)